MTPPPPPWPESDPVSAASETEIHWDRATEFVRRRLRIELSASTRGEIDDLIQETLVRTLRLVRREPVENVEALMTEIARRVAIDALRRRIRWNALLRPEAPEAHEVPDTRPTTDTLGDPLERLQFIVLEYFGAHDAPCRALAAAFFAERDWKSVAAAQGRSHAGVRQQWSRCLRVLRAVAAQEGGPLSDWARVEGSSA
jgi:DNA-directed RNA polymerase specialized sigma24 family protein